MILTEVTCEDGVIAKFVEGGWIYYSSDKVIGCYRFHHGLYLSHAGVMCMIMTTEEIGDMAKELDLCFGAEELYPFLRNEKNKNKKVEVETDDDGYYDDHRGELQLAGGYYPISRELEDDCAF